MRTQAKNPFSITFGKEPIEGIDRENIIEEILSYFTAENPSQQVVLLTGVRGSGKSSLTARLMKTVEQMKDWIVADLIVEGDMLHSLAGKLGESVKVTRLDDETGVEALLDRMLSALTKKNKKLLITIDDVASNKEMRVFSHFFQSCLMKNYNVYLIMNGVYDNIENLQNERTLAFLQRAPKIPLPPLNKTAVAAMYGRIFRFPDNTVKKMAAATCGYPYAVQALGYAVWKNYRDAEDIDMENVLPKLDLMLADGVYDKLWVDMSETDREICSLVAEGDTDGASVASVIEKSGISKSLASNYKKRLIKKGIVEEVRGSFVFSLPGFGRYVREQYEY